MTPPAAEKPCEAPCMACGFGTRGAVILWCDGAHARDLHAEIAALRSRAERAEAGVAELASAQRAWKAVLRLYPDEKVSLAELVKFFDEGILKPTADHAEKGGKA